MAIKLECVKTKHPQLHIEAKFYKMMQSGGVCVCVCVWCAEISYGGLVNFELIFHMYEQSSLAGYLYRHMANLLFVYNNDSSVEMHLLVSLYIICDDLTPSHFPLASYPAFPRLRFLSLTV